MPNHPVLNEPPTLVGYRTLQVTDLYIGGDELCAMVVDGHVPPRVALAAANRFARTVWGCLSLLRESAEDTGWFFYSVTADAIEYRYARTVLCLSKSCWCWEYPGHFEDSSDPLPGGRPVTYVPVT
ncbi:hypothetical protein ACFWY6_06730 [Streptomyces sp. NPDC059037]|uniref:hypothetical protein n=1 Tax=Streptomyces sp. NPDC059037 TaxID=3346710 RepID=UPI00368A50D2